MAVLVRSNKNCFTISFLEQTLALQKDRFILFLLIWKRVAYATLQDDISVCRLKRHNAKYSHLEKYFLSVGARNIVYGIFLLLWGLFFSLNDGG